MHGFCFDDAVIFDLDAARRSAAQMAVEEIWARVGTDAALSLTDERLLEYLDESRRELRDRVASDSQLTLAGFHRLLEEIGVAEPGLALQVDAIYREHRGRVASPFEDAVHLRVLRQNHRIGLIAGQGVDWHVLGEGVVDVPMRPDHLRLDRGDPVLLARMQEALDASTMTVVTTPGSALARAGESAELEVVALDRYRGETLRAL